MKLFPNKQRFEVTLRHRFLHKLRENFELVSTEARCSAAIVFCIRLYKLYNIIKNPENALI